jgi:hypothetical protein
MKKLILLLIPLSSCLPGYSQIPVKRTDSIVNSIESKKGLTVNNVSDTFPTVNANVVIIERVNFYSVKGKLLKVLFSSEYFRRDSVKNNILTQHEIFYFNNDVLIKVISKDFDETPPKDLKIYLNESHLKKYLSKQTLNSTRFDGANYFIELGYNLLEEFKQLIKIKSK